MAHSSDRPDPIRIFCDFDGTISTKDIGYDLFDRFGEQTPWHGDLLAGRIGIREYWRGVAGTLRAPLTDDLLDPYLLSVPIDPAVRDLLALVRRQGIPFTILSDGLSVYVHRYLELHGVDTAGLPIICNRAGLDQEGRLKVEFPYSADGCECPSAVCKRNVVLASAGPDDRVIYIGDGLSDFCPAECADVIFAKGSLAAYCNRNGLPHHSWKRMHEVVRDLEKMLAQPRLRPRHQAVLARKRVWESG